MKSEVKEFFFKLATNDQNDVAFLLRPKFGPIGLSAPVGAIYMYMYKMKKCA